MTADITEVNQEETKDQEKVETGENTPHEPVKAEEEKPSEKPQEDANWKAFREARKRDRQERELAEKRAKEKEAEAEALKAAFEAAFAKGQQGEPPQQNYDSYYQQEESDDDRIEKKVAAIIAQREAENERKRQEEEQRNLPSKLQQSFPDYGQVVNQETLDYLDYHYPEISRPFSQIPDSFDKWSNIYKTVKRLMPNVLDSKKDSQKADVNSMKPKSISGTGITQNRETGSAFLSEERKRANWERMQRTLKGLS